LTLLFEATFSEFAIPEIPPRIRLQDIANDVGVSKVTVSKVLRGSPDVGQATRLKILERMRELNYQPNTFARALAGGLSDSVGLIVPDLVHPFFAEVAKGLGAVLRQSGKVLLLSSSEEDAEVERQQIRALLYRGVDALLIASCREQANPLGPAEFAGTPCVLVDRDFQQGELHFVGSANQRVGSLATEHLLAIGRRRIAHIGSRSASTGLARRDAYLQVLQRAGITRREDYTLTRERFEEMGEQAGYQAMQQLLQLTPRPDAVFCYNDVSAIGAMAATTAAGFSIPEDIAFIGCGNLRYAAYLRTPLTSIDQSAQEMGAIAGRIALDLAGRAVSDQALHKVEIEPTLVVRASTAGPTA
jgi:LacI family transcriptional regulator